MPKHERALALFPSFYDTLQPNGLLYDVARRLGEPLEHADTLLYRIQRAHRLLVVEDLGDLVRLGAALDLGPRHFDDILGEPPPDEPGEERGGNVRDLLRTAYAERLDAARQRIQRIARLHLDGLGTPWALLEGAAIFLDADVVPDQADGRLVHHEDEGGFSHWADVRFSRAHGTPRARVYLHENPLRRRKAEPTERHPLDSWTLRSENVEPSPARIFITGIGDHAVLPAVFCAATGEGIAFSGIVPEGATLVIDEEAGATLEGRPVDEFVSYSVGGRFDVGGQFDPRSGAIGRFIVERDAPRSLFDGDLAHLFGGARHSRSPTPRLPVGPSDWVFTVAIGVCDVSLAEYAVFATPLEPVGRYGEPPGWDASVFEYPASASVGMGWDERIPCALKLLLPPRVALPSPAGSSETRFARIDVSRMSAMIERVRPAGVRAFVDMAPDDWILGDGVLRSAAATEGRGVDHALTTVHVPGSDRFLPLDPSTLNA
jgi:hypothetical protein